MRKEYLLLDRIEGPLIELSDVDEVGYGEVVEVKTSGNEKKLGKVVKIEGNKVIVQVFGDTSGISIENSTVNFKGEPLELPLSRDILGRTFNGLGRPIDGGGNIYSKKNIM